MELEPDFVAAKAVTGQARPVDRVLAFLNSLLGCTPALIELRQLCPVKAKTCPHSAKWPLDRDSRRQISSIGSEPTRPTARRRGPKPKISDEDLLAAILADLEASIFEGEGPQGLGSAAGAAVDTAHHLIVTHEVINVGNDRAQLSPMAKKAKAALEADKLDVVADRGYFDSEEILACEQAGITVTPPKPMTSGAKAEGRFAKQDFRNPTGPQGVTFCLIWVNKTACR